MGKRATVRVHNERKSDGVRAYHDKKRCDGVRVQDEKKSDGVIVDHKKERWGEK